MQLSIAATLLACTAVRAFSDSSPFVLFSTVELPLPPNNAQLQTSSKVISAAQHLLDSCPTSRYYLVSQPNVHAADIRDTATARCNLPNLCRTMTADTTRSRFSVAEVIGQVSGKPLADHVAAACSAKGKVAKVERVELAHLPGLEETEKRREVLADNDHELGRLLDTLNGDYTVVMFSDPNEFKAYEPEFVEPVHMDLKRHAELEAASLAAMRRKEKNSTVSVPLFEKYQFFTPGIFSGIIALIVILSILTVGLKALASLEVSYGAFDKEMGPAAQKKQG